MRKQSISLFCFHLTEIDELYIICLPSSLEPERHLKHECILFVFVFVTIYHLFAIRKFTFCLRCVCALLPYSFVYACAYTSVTT